MRKLTFRKAKQHAEVLRTWEVRHPSSNAQCKVTSIASDKTSAVKRA
jgi:hypothetical protein